jgi:hypothetical protein
LIDVLTVYPKDNGQIAETMNKKMIPSDRKSLFKFYMPPSSILNQIYGI